MSDTMVRVFNRNRFDYEEMYNGTLIKIKAGGFVTMDYEQATRFMGKMIPMIKDKGGIQKPESYKWLEMDQDDKRKAESSLRNEAEEKAQKTFVCMKCNKEFTTKAALIKHAKEKHLDDMVESKTKEDIEETEP